MNCLCQRLWMRGNCHNNNLSPLLSVKEEYSISRRCILLGVSLKNLFSAWPLKRRKLMCLQAGMAGILLQKPKGFGYCLKALFKMSGLLQFLKVGFGSRRKTQEEPHNFFKKDSRLSTCSVLPSCASFKPLRSFSITSGFWYIHASLAGIDTDGLNKISPFLPIKIWYASAFIRLLSNLVSLPPKVILNLESSGLVWYEINSSWMSIVSL